MTCARLRRARPRAAAVCALGAALLVGGVAPAYTQMDGEGVLAAGATTNATSASPGSDGGADGIGQARLRLGVSRIGARSQNAVGLDLSAYAYAQQRGASSVAALLGWTGLFSPSAMLDMRFQVGGGYSRLTAVRAVEQVQIGVPEALPAGSLGVVSATAGQALTLRPAPRWALTEEVGGSAVRPLGDVRPPGYGVSGRLAVERLWARDVLGLEVVGGVGWMRPLVVAGETRTPASESFTGRALISEAHDLSARWNLSGGAGVLAAHLLDTPRWLVGPAWRAVLRYQAERGLAALEVDRAPTFNVLLGTTIVADRVTVRAGLPLDAGERLRLAALAGYQHGQALAPTGEPAGTMHLVSGGTSLVYARPGERVSYGLDYTFHVQRSSADTVPAFQRHIVMFTVRMMLGELPRS